MNASGIDQGVVTKVEGHLAYVELESGDACESCGARNLCVPLSGGTRSIVAANPENARVGDRVTVEEQGQPVLTLSALQYGLPLLGFFIGILFVYGGLIRIPFLAPELGMFLSGLIGLGGGGVLAWWGIKRLSRRPGRFFTVRLLR
ncbi:MAG: SoxR reducing system RseC family protein [FCB group bacterium]|nr:SoxR reducing system RseC family protein [FCB group bacterium]